jgi:hypothetical protein
MTRRTLFLAILFVVGPPILLRADDPSSDNPRPVIEDDLWAIKIIEEVGGKVVRDENQEGAPVIAVDLEGTHVSTIGTLPVTKSTITATAGGRKINDSANNIALG